MFVQSLMRLVKLVGILYPEFKRKSQFSAFLEYFKSYFKLLLFSVSEGIFQRDLECNDGRGIRHTSLSQRSLR